MSTFLRVFPDSSHVVVVLNNRDPPRANWLADVFVNGMPLSPPATPAAATAEPSAADDTPR